MMVTNEDGCKLSIHNFRYNVISFKKIIWDLYKENHDRLYILK